MTNTDNVDLLYSVLGDLKLRFKEVYPEKRTEMIPSRFPFTYAYDCVRTYPKLVPAEHRIIGGWPQETRGEAAGQVRVWAEEEGVTRSILCVALAMTYLVAQNIPLDSHRYTEVMDNIEAGKSNADL